MKCTVVVMQAAQGSQANMKTESVCECWSLCSGADPSPVPFLLHQAWLEHHSRSLGLFIDGKFVCSADGRSCSLADSKGESSPSTQLHRS